MPYKNLEIWQLASDLVIEIHKMTIYELPKFELFEQGSKIRRTSKSVPSQRVTGYGRRHYKQNYNYAVLVSSIYTDIYNNRWFL